MSSDSQEPPPHLYCWLSSHWLAEDPLQYVDGNFLAVEPGQEIGTGELKHRIFAKLGYGSFSTVWLVRPVGMKSTEEGGWRALKILKANYSNASQEVESVQAVRNCNVEVAGCVDTKDSWLEVRGEKTYLCLLIQLSGPSISELLQFSGQSRRKRCLLAKNVVEVMAKLYDGNIFINGRIFTSLTYTSDVMMATIKSESENVRQIFINEDGKQRYEQPVEPIPKRLYGNASFIKLVNANLSLETIDVHQDGPENVVAAAFASPESLQNKPPDSKSNIWTLGVLVSITKRLLCRMLSEHYPFESNWRTDVAREHNDFFARKINAKYSFGILSILALMRGVVSSIETDKSVS
ncbi:serine threonine kinase-36 protein [Rutstroemia sp. NJR-2017a BBW]|nr:serine threonine kinase-36 protein [Rutstroemia sp. NJR-2017a BBW]